MSSPNNDKSCPGATLVKGPRSAASVVHTSGEEAANRSRLASAPPLCAGALPWLSRATRPRFCIVIGEGREDKLDLKPNARCVSERELASALSRGTRGTG